MINLTNSYLVPVTNVLITRIAQLKNGQTWRELQHVIPGWKWSHSLLADIASGKVITTSLAVYEVLGITPPLLIIAGPGSIIIGSGQGLLSPEQAIVYIAIQPEEWKRHSIECEVCGTTCPRWSSTQKYCDKHSWSTPEGKKYQRKKWTCA